MGKLFPPFKVDIAGALCVPFALRDARSRYQHGQISLSALRAIENKEICKLMERLKLEGIEVVTDGEKQGDIIKTKIPIFYWYYMSLLSC